MHLEEDQSIEELVQSEAYEDKLVLVEDSAFIRQ
jgi:hypothetical protein